MTLAFIGNGDMQVYGLTIKSKTMGKEKVTVNDLKVTLSEIGVTSGLKQEKIIQRLQVNGCLIAMVTDVLDQLIKDEQGMFRMLSVQYKQEQKMHYTQMQDAAKKYYFHLKPFNKSFFGDENICANLEDNANDIYEIIKLLADHTNDHKDMEVIKRYWEPRWALYYATKGGCHGRVDHRIGKAEKITARYSRKLMNCLARFAGKTHFDIRDISSSANKLKRYDL